MPPRTWVRHASSGVLRMHTQLSCSRRRQGLRHAILFVQSKAIHSLHPSHCIAAASAGLAGLLLTATLDLTDRLTWMVRQTTEVELNMNSVERILEYTDLPLELDTTKPAARCACPHDLGPGAGAHILPCVHNEVLASTDCNMACTTVSTRMQLLGNYHMRRGCACKDCFGLMTLRPQLLLCLLGRLPEVWPSDGAIDVQSLVVRYRPELDPVLNGLSFSVRGTSYSRRQCWSQLIFTR